VPGPQELLVIAVVALLVFGPDRLPEVARNAARFIAKFREHSQKSIEELKRAAELDGLDREIRGLSQELRDTTSSVERAARGEMPARSVRAEDEPPPMDPEAT
jgi:sec-independent protein translocase protein TatB